MPKAAKIEFVRPDDRIYAAGRSRIKLLDEHDEPIGELDVEGDAITYDKERSAVAIFAHLQSANLADGAFLGPCLGAGPSGCSRQPVYCSAQVSLSASSVGRGVNSLTSPPCDIEFRPNHAWS